MKPVITRRQFVLGSTALLALSGIARSTLGQMQAGRNMPVWTRWW